MLFFDKILLWIMFIGFLIATALYLLKEAGRVRRDR